jgi:glycosyltransferase involved in cell wall biosynthesis
MPGISPTALGWIGDGSIFVLSSRFEGFPNALCEAMLAGYAVVATDCRFGPREIITDGRDGLLVADEAPAPPAALARAMQRLAEDPALRQGLAAAARASAARFDLAAVIPAWTALVHRLGGP